MTAHGDRMRRSYALTARDRRAWVNRLIAKQMELEAVEEALHKLMTEANDVGVSYETIGGALAIHGSTAKGIADRYRSRQSQTDEGPEGD